MEQSVQGAGHASAAILLLGILLLLLGLVVPLLFLVGTIFAFIGVVIHILTPHHTHPAWLAVGTGDPCPGCGTPLTWVDELKRWYCAKEQLYR